jgi:hypothetical protein
VGVARLEETLPRIETRLDAIDGRLRTVEQGLAGVTAKLDLLTDKVVGKLPSWWQMPAVIGSTVTLLAGLYALVQYLHAKGLL